MSASSRFFLRALIVLLIVGMVALATAVAGFFVARSIYAADLPSPEAVRELPLQVPMRIYTADGKLIGEFGAERRLPLRYDELPTRMIQAFLAAEDERFFSHPGVDWRGILRAAINLALTGEKTQGGSTITMQLARNYFLTRERTYDRKIREIFLALHMEKSLSKEEILETYLNKIFLGQRAYGVGAAAMTYFGVPVEELSLSQTAVLAGLPKAPSRDNPVDNPSAARDRRDYVLRRMYALGHIRSDQYQAALAAPVVASLQPVAVEVDAHYMAEMVRIDLANRYGEAVYTGGYKVWTTLDSREQAAAVRAVRRQLLSFGERASFEPLAGELPAVLAQNLAVAPESVRDAVLVQLAEQPRQAGLLPAVVTAHDDSGLHVLNLDGIEVQVAANDPALGRLGDRRLPVGGLVYVRSEGETWRLTRPPDVQAAFVAMDTETGALRALVGGYDFFAGRYNRATQARRQPGSVFKPILFAAALDKGYTPASVLMDTPIVLDDTQLEDTWRPRNYSGRFYGPTRLREALVHSRNIVAIRLLQGTGINHARRYAARFGLPIERMPRNLSLALGSPVFTPLEMTSAFAVFANGGFLVEPYYIQRIEGPDGELIEEAEPARACGRCELDRQLRDAARQRAEAEAAERAALAWMQAAGDAHGDADPWAEAAGDADLPQDDNGDHGFDAPSPGDADGDIEAMTDEAMAQEAIETGPLAPRIIDARIAYLMTDMLREVARRGTAARARELGRSDVAGKTGTTNDETDAWFIGYTPTLVATVWVGHDQPQSLGRGEVGGRAALPIWVEFMRTALEGVPQQTPPRPPGLVSVRIDPQTGRLAAAGAPDAIFELVQAEHMPEAVARSDGGGGLRDTGATLDELY